MRSSLYNGSVMVLGDGEHHTRLHLHAKTDQGHELMATKLGVRGFGRAMANEKKYPHIVKLAVSKIGLDPGLARRIMNFHNSRHIRPRHGSINFSDSKKKCITDGAFPICRRLTPSSKSLMDGSTNLIANAR